MAKITQRTKTLNTLQKLVRLKAADDSGYCTCVTCGVTKKWNDGMQGGHFIAKGNGGTNQWALEPENVHPQCAGCNGFKMAYGNAESTYTLYMIDMYGRDKVEQMLHENKVVKLSRADLEDMEAEWKIEINEHLKRIG
mgnify:FL=1